MDTGTLLSSTTNYQDEPPSAITTDPAPVLETIFETINKEIIPLTAKKIKEGNEFAFFGAAILTRPPNPTLICIAVNEVDKSPLIHGENHCIQTFYSLSADKRPPASQCLFFTTHEPCPMCMGSIIWGGFREFFYLFDYDETAEHFASPEDKMMLEEVFRVRAPGDTDESLRGRPLYNKRNKYFTSKSVAELVEEVGDEDRREHLRAELAEVKKSYRQFMKSS